MPERDELEDRQVLGRVEAELLFSQVERPLRMLAGELELASVKPSGLEQLRQVAVPGAAKSRLVIDIGIELARCVQERSARGRGGAVRGQETFGGMDSDELYDDDAGDDYFAEELRYAVTALVDDHASGLSA